MDTISNEESLDAFGELNIINHLITEKDLEPFKERSRTSIKTFRNGFIYCCYMPCEREQIKSLEYILGAAEESKLTIESMGYNNYTKELFIKYGEIKDTVYISANENIRTAKVETS